MRKTRRVYWPMSPPILSRAGISIDAIMQQSRLKDLIPIVILTDPVLESKMDEALANSGITYNSWRNHQIRLNRSIVNRVEEKCIPFSTSLEHHHVECQSLYWSCRPLS